MLRRGAVLISVLVVLVLTAATVFGSGSDALDSYKVEGVENDTETIITSDFNGFDLFQPPISIFSYSSTKECSSSPCVIGSGYVYYYHTAHHFTSNIITDPRTCGYDSPCDTPILQMELDNIDLRNYDITGGFIGFGGLGGPSYWSGNLFIDMRTITCTVNTPYGLQCHMQPVAPQCHNERVGYFPQSQGINDWKTYLGYFISKETLTDFGCSGAGCWCQDDLYCGKDKWCYYVDFWDDGWIGNWKIKNTYLYLQHVSEDYFTPLITFSVPASQIASPELVFDVEGSNPDALGGEQGYLDISLYDSNGNHIVQFFREKITGFETKRKEILKYYLENYPDGIYFKFSIKGGYGKYIISNVRIEYTQLCSDGTPYGECSNSKPLYCDDGTLIKKCSECGCPSSEWVGNPYCYNDEICKNYKVYTCEGSGLCSYDYEIKIIEDCEYVCSDAQCVRCNQDSDCGENEWIGDPYCCEYWPGQGMKACQIQRIHSCVIGGQPDAYCSYYEEERLKEACGIDACYPWGSNYCSNGDVYHSRNCYDRGCDNGACYENQYIDEELVQDCGISYCGDWGSNYCKNDDVYRSRTCHDRGCSAAACFDNTNTEEEKIQECGSDSCDSWGSWYCSSSTQRERERTCYDRGCYGGSCFENSWTDAQTENCSAGQVCQDGQCIEECLDECSAGEMRCTIKHQKQTCGDYDSDPCWEWGGDQCDFGCGATCETDADCNPKCIGDTYYQNTTCMNGYQEICQCLLYAPDNCSDCSCSCGGYNQNETIANDNCNDGIDNDCDGKTDGTDDGCIQLPGDANHDCIVDIFDLAIVGLAFNSQSGDPNWNPNADLNNDSKIDVFDLATVGVNYGNSC